MIDVDPDAIRRFAEALGSLADDVAAAHRYMIVHSTIEFPDMGVITVVRPVHNNFREGLSQRLSHLEDLLRRSRHELLLVAHHYASADAQAAAAVDMALPESPRPEVHRPY